MACSSMGEDNERGTSERVWGQAESPPVLHSGDHDSLTKFHIYSPFHMPDKREVPIVKCDGGKLRNRRVRFVRSTFDWVVCSEPLAGLRRTR